MSRRRTDKPWKREGFDIWVYAYLSFESSPWWGVFWGFTNFFRQLDLGKEGQREGKWRRGKGNGTDEQEEGQWVGTEGEEKWRGRKNGKEEEERGFFPLPPRYIDSGYIPESRGGGNGWSERAKRNTVRKTKAIPKDSLFSNQFAVSQFADWSFRGTY